ncbi:hypothetical protein BRN16_06380, partial [Xanthomonas oryzae pv. oryzae]
MADMARRWGLLRASLPAQLRFACGNRWRALAVFTGQAASACPAAVWVAYSPTACAGPGSDR